MSAPAVHLRPVTPADDAVLLAIYASTRSEELALTGWDAATTASFVQMQWRAQATHYRQSHPQSEHLLVLCGPAPGRAACAAESAALPVAGRLWIDRGPRRLHVLDIALLPAHRGRGIGGECLRRLIDEAAAGGRSVSIHVETGNPARRLYERLGFQPQGPLQGMHQLMVWRDAGHATPPFEETCDEQA